MADTNSRFLLRERPTGRIEPSTFELVESPVPEIGDGEALVRISYISLDPTNRAWIGETPTYLPPVAIGEVMRAGALGRVVASKHPGYPEGALLQGLFGWQEYAVVSDAAPAWTMPEQEGIPDSAWLGVLGQNGLTAYVGMHDIGAPKEGETVVVSAAAGAVGSIAAQIAKIMGARVVGIAGGPEKCRAVVEDFGFDACIDHRGPDLHAALREACPDRVDVYFDNVGGPILDAVLGRIATRARVVLCGVISSYLTGEHPGPANYVNLLARTARMEGFNTLDTWGRFDEAFAALRGWEADGLLRRREHVVVGLDHAVAALNGLFTGANIGKTVVQVSEPSVG